MGTQIIALGGFGEVGRNCCAIDVDGKIIICDMGFHLERFLEASEDTVFDRKGYVRKLMNAGAFPDFRHLGKRVEDVVAIVISHAHVDHIGAIPFFSKKFNCPIFATPFTAHFIRSLAEGRRSPVNVIEKQPGDTFFIEGIQIDFIPVCHSTPQSVNIAVHTPEGVVLYCNDYKEDEWHGEATDMNMFSQYKGKTKAMILDSLYAPQDFPQASEAKAHEKVLAQADALRGFRTIFASTFSSHIYRLESLCDLADKIGRKVVFLGRSLSRYIQAAKDAGIADLSTRGEICGYSRASADFLAKLNNPEEYFIITTGHQGEPDAMLNRIVDGLYGINHEDVVLFSSRVIPSPVTAKNSLELRAKLKDRGVHMLVDVHESGHAAGPDHDKLLQLVQPEILVPSHALSHMVDAMQERANKLGITHVEKMEVGERIRLNSD